MKRPQQELSISVWVDNSQILAPKPVPGNLGLTVLHTFNIPAFGDSRFTGGCFSGRGLEDECEVCTLHIRGMYIIEILTSYMYATKYLPMYPL
jgi:hypothetical protein